MFGPCRKVSILIKNLCKVYAKMRHGNITQKGRQNGAKMVTKISSKMKNGMKKTCNKIMPKLGAQKGDQKSAKGRKRK